MTLGSDRWEEEFGAFYGANRDKPVMGEMPSFADEGFSVEEVKQVVYYERVRFGGADPETETLACGLEWLEPSPAEAVVSGPRA